VAAFARSVRPLGWRRAARRCGRCSPTATDEILSGRPKLCSPGSTETGGASPQWQGGGVDTELVDRGSQDGWLANGHNPDFGLLQAAGYTRTSGAPSPHAGPRQGTSSTATRNATVHDRLTLGHWYTRVAISRSYLRKRSRPADSAHRRCISQGNTKRELYTDRWRTSLTTMTVGREQLLADVVEVVVIG